MLRRGQDFCRVLEGDTKWRYFFPQHKKVNAIKFPASGIIRKAAKNVVEREAGKTTYGFNV